MVLSGRIRKYVWTGRKLDSYALGRQTCFDQGKRTCREMYGREEPLVTRAWCYRKVMKYITWNIIAVIYLRGSLKLCLGHLHTYAHCRWCGEIFNFFSKKKKKKKSLEIQVFVAIFVFSFKMSTNKPSICLMVIEINFLNV